MKKIYIFLPLLTILVIEILHSNYIIELIRSLLPIWIVLVLGGMVYGVYTGYKSPKFTWKQFVISLTSILVILYPFKIYAFYNQINTSDVSGENIKVVTSNLWWQNREYQDILNFINIENPEILILIEYTDLQHQNIREDLKKKYPYSNVTPEQLSQPFAGNIIFSKYKINNSVDRITRGYYSGFAKVDVEIENNDYEFFIVHTTAPINQEYFGYRNDQLEELSNEVNASEYENIIITGDLNISPWSRYYKEFESDLGDNIRNISGTNGFEFSWEDRDNPFIKSHIDHTFTSKQVEITDYRIEDFPGSDHRAQIFNFNVESI